MREVTRILNRAEQGDPKAAEELLPLVYDELRKLAAARMAQQPPGQTLQATALVHEAWLRLESADKPSWASRQHFFAAAAQAMRHILIERARRRLRARHGAGLERVDATDIDIAAPINDDERILQLNEALDALEKVAAEQAEVVKLRFFVGLSEQEIAELLNLSPRTVERYWSYAKAWLFAHLAHPRPTQNVGG
jgi:RNA polymerase sigma factor (TIGR02999 family)